MDIITRINWVDILIVIAMLRVTYVAFQDGLSHEIFPLIGVAAIAVSSFHYYQKFSVFLSKNVINLPPVILDFVAFTILAVGTGFLFKLIKVILNKIIQVAWHPAIEKGGGLAVGLMKAAVMTSLVLVMLSLLPLSYMQHSIRDRSLAGIYFIKISPEIYEKATILFPSIKSGGAALTKEDIVKGLLADKSIFTNKTPR